MAVVEGQMWSLVIVMSLLLLVNCGFFLLPPTVADFLSSWTLLNFCISLFSSDGALGRKTTGRRTSTQARTVCRRKRLFGSEIRLVCKTKFWIKWYNTKVSQYQINNHKLFKNLQAYDIKQADSSAPTQCSTEPVGCSVLGICPVSYYQTIFPFLCVHVTYIDQVPYAWNLSSMMLLLQWVLKAGNDQVRETAFRDCKHNLFKQVVSIYLK